MHILERAARAWLIFAISMFGAFVSAITFVVMFTYSLPPSDGAYGQAPFEDPVVFPVMSMFAVGAGVIAFLGALAFLWRTSLLRSTCFVFVIVLTEIVLVTPTLHAAAVPGALVAMLAAMALSHWLFRESPERPSVSGPARAA
jgi:hypothetical protein